MVLDFGSVPDVFNKSPEDNQVDKYAGGRQIPADADEVSISNPIGCIVAWLKSLTGVPQVLPSGWVECDGATISDPASPMNGEDTPDLMGTEPFLRGNNTSGGTGGGTTGSGSAHLHGGTASGTTGNESSHTHGGTTNANTTGAATQSGTGVTRPTQSHAHTFSTGSGSSHQHSFSDSFNVNNESAHTHASQPKFYDVVWIMRIK